MRTGELGFWWRSLGGARATHPPLEGNLEADIAIVGGGFTGLWTAYYLARSDPALKIVLLERELLGYGASGRNGGWISGFFSGPPRAYARGGGPAGYPALQQAMFETVDEILAVAGELGIDADIHYGGGLTIALGPAQERRLREHVAHRQAEGLKPQDLRVLERDELHGRLRMSGATVASYSPHLARAQPAKLVTGLAAAVADAGVSIHETTPVTSIEPGRAVTDAGTVRARWVIRTTEGYTPSLPGVRRLLVPVNSSMIVTEPLSERAWSEIGWHGAEVVADGAHVYVYLQRTADGRIAIGGRGVPYRFGSRTDGDGATAPRTVASLHARLSEMFPAAAGTAVEHAWSGVLGVPRDWCPSIHADPASGLAWAGGYVGEGVAASNLAARTLRDLVLGRESELVALPWVGHSARTWEREPARWLGIRGLYSAYRLADRFEARTGRDSRLARLADAVSGRE